MNKFTKGALIAAGCFFAGGVVLGIIGAAGRIYTGEPAVIEEDLGIVRNTWNKVRGWDLRWRRGGGVRGLTLEYGGIEYDKDHKDSIVYGSFTDDSLRGTEIYHLDVEIGGGSLTIQQGDGLQLKKEGGPECQYYIEDSTFYLKQKSPVGGGSADLTLTLPDGVLLDKVDIEIAAGAVVTRDVLAAKEIEVEMSAGEVTMEEVNVDSFSAKVAAGSVAVQRMEAEECGVEVSMGDITLRDSLVTGNLDAEVSMGEINVFLRDSYENHDYRINCGMGNVTVSSENGGVSEYAGLGSSTDLCGRNSGGTSVYDLDCGMGSIYIKFEGGTEPPEVPEPSEVPEIPEAPELPAVPEIPAIYGIVNEWPDRVGRENENTSAEEFSFEIRVTEPTVLVVSCVTKSGELDLEIEDEDGEEVFEKDDIRTGEYEVRLKSSGTYRVYFDCEKHTGSFWISPKK